MANVLLLGVKVPFTSGGQDVLLRTLRDQLVLRGHTVDAIELPISMRSKEFLLVQAAQWRSLDLEECGGLKVDLVIATKFPSYYAKHPKKSVWLVHQHRAAYDLYGGRYSDFSDDPRDEELRAALLKGDSQVLGEAQFISGISGNVIKRLKEFNGIDGKILYPPLALAGRYYSSAAEGSYILSVGRICAIKRVDLIVKALPNIHPFMRLKVVGQADESGIMDYLNNEIAKHHLQDRVEFLGRVSDEELLELYAKSYCVYYAPHDEDYGYVTLEAMASGKPVITATDSGGVLEFIRDRENGLISNPDTDSIAKAVNELAEDNDFALKLGQQGRIDIDQLGIEQAGWDEVIEGLLSPLANTNL
jgi:glycosyltransferase involved in cell wall biosynthesis